MGFNSGFKGLTQKLEVVRRYLVDMPLGGKARAQRHPQLPSCAACLCGIAFGNGAQRHPKLPSCAACLGGIAFGSVNVRAQDLRAAACASTCMRDEAAYWCSKHVSTGCQLLSQMMTKSRHNTFKAPVGQLFPP